jgi:DNA-binding XRE family transcriptional regulator
MEKEKTRDAERESAPQKDEARTSHPAPDPGAKEANAGKSDGKATARHGAHGKKKGANNVRKLRMERMMSKAELARRAGMSTLTIDRVERGLPSRMDTKRKILEALGLKPTDRVMVFGDEPEDEEVE